MITEDYVSFEVAKLLKEKGFGIEEETCGYYPTKGDALGRLMFGAEYHHNTSQVQIAAPTQSDAMKWLRENHNVFIEMKRDNQYYLGMPVTPVTKEDKERGHKPLYYANVLDEKADSMTTEKRESYEEAVEEALKIALKNEMYLK